MTTNITKSDFVFIINCIKALDAESETEKYPQGQVLMEQLSDTLLRLLEVVIKDTGTHNIETWLFDPEFTLTVIKIDGKWCYWYPETAEDLYDWLTGVYDDLDDTQDEEGKVEDSELF